MDSESMGQTLKELKDAADPSRSLTAFGPGALDQRTRGLVGIGAAVSLGASTPTYRRLIDEARQGGATADDCIGAFIAAAPVAGAVRLVTGAPRLASALGYDVGQALE
ncbi:MAG TPA: carboxymuconolactone decarboxylase family protein [Acidimicrobiia bacterium]|nr:carboxymuconolactone decarboxylase family protein [Acidimicrobiia bacterium]